MKLKVIETAFTVTVQLVMAIGFWAAAIWCWPDGITNIPLANLTLRDIGLAVGSFLLTMIGFGAVVKAITDPNS